MDAPERTNDDVWFFCQDRGGYNTIKPVREWLLGQVPDLKTRLFASGTAANVFKEEGTAFVSCSGPGAAITNFGGYPRVVVTSMCSELGRNMIGLINVSSAISPTKPLTVAITDYWGGRLTTTWANKEFRPDYICVNDLIEKAVVQKAWKEYDVGRILVPGYPYIDAYYHYDKNAIRKTMWETFGLGSRPVVLYVGDVELGGWELHYFVVALIFASEEVDFIARPHPNLRRDNPAEAYLWDKALQLFEHANIGKLHNEMNVSPARDVLAASQIVVSRFSTMTFEAALLNVECNLAFLLPEGHDIFEKAVGGLLDDPPMVENGFAKKVTSAGRMGLALQDAYRRLRSDRAGFHDKGYEKGKYPFDGDCSKRVGRIILSQFEP